MSIKQKIIDYINNVDEPESSSTEDIGGMETTENVGETEQFEASTKEPTEFDTAEEIEQIVVVNSDDLVAESLDMRLATFYTELTDLKNTVKILTMQVQDLTNKFQEINADIDTIENISLEQSNFVDLINKI